VVCPDGRDEISQHTSGYGEEKVTLNGKVKNTHGEE
jgi:hypothetical protein